jgi:hypothetical protein
LVLGKLKYLPAMRSFLQQPYPFSDNVRNKLLVCGGVGLFITLFLAVFEPFGFDELQTTEKWIHAALFGLVTFLIASFFQVVLPTVAPSLFREEGWRSWKEVVYLLLTTLVIGAGNYGLMLYLYPQQVELANFFRAQLFTLQVGVFPILAIVFMKQMTLYRRYAAEARQVSDEIAEEKKESEPAQPVVPKLTLRGENQKEELQLFPQDLFFVASADNYVKVQYRDGSKPQSVILRSSLKRLEEQLAGYPEFFRCHRMYLVNLSLVTTVSGNAQGLKLHLSALEEAIPVSRSLTETVREKLHQLSHSPQNA